jgi:hypothetical protein
MDPEELREKLSDAGIEISDPDKKWLEIVHSYADREESPTKAELITRHFDDLPENFRPSEVNGALQDEAREGDDVPRLTTLGTLLVDPDSQIPHRVDATIRAIRSILKEEPGKTEVGAEEVADHMNHDPDLPDLEVLEVERAFGDLDDLGGFRTGGTRREGLETGYSGLRFSRGAEKVIPNYLEYEDFEQLVDRRIQDLKDRHQGPGGLVGAQSDVGGSPSTSTGQFYVSPERIDQLQAVESGEFDLTRLIKLCEELNDCYQSRDYHAIAMLVRTIIDHVPPVFGFESFDEVVNNDGKLSRSLREAIEKLNDSYRKIADRHLHDQIRSSESLPTQKQVDFSSELDFLLMEVERRLNA